MLQRSSAESTKYLGVEAVCCVRLGYDGKAGRRIQPSVPMRSETVTNSARITIMGIDHCLLLTVQKFREMNHRIASESYCS
jgi:hypothetical protein